MQPFTCKPHSPIIMMNPRLLVQAKTHGRLLKLVVVSVADMFFFNL